MSKDIDIQYELERIPTKIVIDGKSYPIHQLNRAIVNEYWITNDAKVLDKLKDFALEF